MKPALLSLAKTLEHKDIPVVDDQSFYPDEVNLPYLALGEIQEDKINTIHNRTYKFVYAKNKSSFSMIRKHIREFYRARKDRGEKIPSRNKIIVVESPDNSFSVKIFNRGFKFINPYLLSEAKGNTLRKLNKQVNVLTSEYVRLNAYLQRHMKKSHKNKYNKLKRESKYSGPIASVALAFVSMMSADAVILHTHYNNNIDSIPYIELKTEPKDKDWDAMVRLLDIHIRKNHKHYIRLQRYLDGFSKQQKHNLVVGLPAGYGCLEENKKYNDMLGIFAIYTKNMISLNQGYITNQDLKNDIADIKAFNTYLQKI